MLYALTPRVDKGNLCETFFFNQVNSLYITNMPPQGDFFVDNHFLFEVGRKGKSFDQIKDVPNSFLAIDDVKYGRKNRIPLWMFGLLY